MYSPFVFFDFTSDLEVAGQHPNFIEMASQLILSLWSSVVQYIGPYSIHQTIAR